MNDEMGEIDDCAIHLAIPELKQLLVSDSGVSARAATLPLVMAVPVAVAGVTAYPTVCHGISVVGNRPDEPRHLSFEPIDRMPVRHTWTFPLNRMQYACSLTSGVHLKARP